MASKTTLNAKNLEALGTETLARLLIEISTGNAAAKRRLRLELAGAQGTDEIAREVRKRLITIARARTFIDWQKRKGVVEDLRTQKRAIVETIAKTDPAEALDLGWRFMATADSIFERTDDSSGTFISLFHEMVEDLGRLALAADADPIALADRAFVALRGNDYGQNDALIAALAPALGATSLSHLKARFVAWSNEPDEPTPAAEDRRIIGYGTNGPIYADEVEGRMRESTIRLALEAIADAEGDADAFIAQQSEAARTVPTVAAEIARRLLAAERPQEALDALDRIQGRPSDRFGRDMGVSREWEDTRLAVLEALGRDDEAQALRWQWFSQDLSAHHLRAHLQRLPDFDDIEAEDRAIALAFAYPEPLRALAFLIEWRALDKAAALVLDPEREWDGDFYELLTPAAETLSEKHPLAATRLLRSMITFSLEEGRTKRYRHAARHLIQCADLSNRIDAFAPIEPHAAYVESLRETHGRKASFWSQMRNG